jgi:parallel beta-helix repeat protein
MANYETLKKSVKQVIKSNGNQAITGQVLQNTLLSIISSVGVNYQFVGIATPATTPGTPDGNVFYIAGEGTYINFSNLKIDTGQLGILKWNGIWSKEVLKFNIDEIPTEGSINPVTSRGIRHALDIQKEDVDKAKEDAIKAIDERENSALLNFSSQRVTPEMLSESTKQLIEASGGGTITNLADDEDLESIDDGTGSKVLKLKNKVYNPLNFSGLGYCILRKNISDGKNILTQDIINEPNTIYEIRYDYDLNGATVTIPDNCSIYFKGGSIKNGKIVFSNTLLFGDICMRNTFPTGKILNNDIETKWFVDGDEDNVSEILNSVIETNDSIVFSNKIIYNLNPTGSYTHINTGRYCILCGNNKRIRFEKNCIINAEHSVLYVKGDNSIIEGFYKKWDSTPTTGKLYTIAGIVVNGSNNIIRNCTVINGKHGIVMFFSSSSKIESCHFESTDHKGAASCHIAGSSKIFVINCTMLGGKDGNVNLYGECSDCEITGCTIGLSEQNVVIESSYNCKINNCNIYGGGTYDNGFIGAIINRSFNCSIENCNIYKLHYAIFVRETDIPTNITGYPCECISIQNNKISDISPVEGDFPDSRAIACMYFKNLLISGNTFYRCNVEGSDIYIDKHWEEEPPKGANSESVVITNNIFHKNSYEFGKGYFTNQKPAIFVNAGGKVVVSNNSCISDNVCDYFLKANVSKLIVQGNINNSSVEAGSVKFIELLKDCDTLNVSNNIWEGNPIAYTPFIKTVGSIKNAIVTNNRFDCFTNLGSVPDFFSGDDIEFCQFIGNSWRGGNFIICSNFRNSIVSLNVWNTAFPKPYYITGEIKNIAQYLNIKHKDNTEETFYPSLVDGISLIKETYQGYQYFDTKENIQKIMVDNRFVGFDGFDAKRRTGNTSERPTGIIKGFQYYDNQINKPIWWDGVKWVDSNGSQV